MSKLSEIDMLIEEIQDLILDGEEKTTAIDTVCRINDLTSDEENCLKYFIKTLKKDLTN